MYLNYFAKIRAHQLCCYPYTSTSAVRCVWIFCRPQVWRRTENQFWSSVGWAPVRACKLGSESSITIEKISFWSGWSTWDQHLVLIAYIETGFHEQILLRKWRLQPSTSKMLMGFYPSNVKIEHKLTIKFDLQDIYILVLTLSRSFICLCHLNTELSLCSNEIIRGVTRLNFKLEANFRRQIHGDIEV